MTLKFDTRFSGDLNATFCDSGILTTPCKFWLTEEPSNGTTLIHVTTETEKVIFAIGTRGLEISHLRGKALTYYHIGDPEMEPVTKGKVCIPGGPPLPFSIHQKTSYGHMEDASLHLYASFTLAHEIHPGVFEDFGWHCIELVGSTLKVPIRGN